MRARSQRLRSWSSRGTNTPCSSRRAGRRAESKQNSAASACTSGCAVALASSSSSARRSASEHRNGRTGSRGLLPAQLPQPAAPPVQPPVDGLGVDQERLTDLFGRQAAQPPQDQGHVRLTVQAGVAHREHHRQLAGVLGGRGQCRLDRAGQRRHRGQLRQERAVALFPADDVDRPVAGGPDDPRLRVLRQPEAPGVHGTDQRVMDDVLGERDVGRAQNPGQRADQVRVLLPEQILDQLRR